MMKNTAKLISLFLTIWLAGPLHAQDAGDALLPEANPDFEFDYTTPQPIAFDSFKAAAAWADVVAIAQVINVDYEQTREINAKGQAFLDVLVPYKGVSKGEFLIVSSKGFEEHVCYYPDRDGEGQRFLVFLKNSKNDGEYIGFKPFCQLQVLLTDTGQYALRYPADTNIEVADELIQTINYNDPHARIDATEWTGISREEHQQKYQSKMSMDEDLFQKYYYLTYTQGIMIHEIRKLMEIPITARIRSDQM